MEKLEYVTAKGFIFLIQASTIVIIYEFLDFIIQIL